MSDIPIGVFQRLQQEIAKREVELAAIKKTLELLRGREYAVAVDAPPFELPVGEFAHMGPSDAARVLLGRNGPMTSRQLHDAMLKGGLQTRSVNFMNAMQTTLKKARGIRYENRQWALEE